MTTTSLRIDRRAWLLGIGQANAEIADCRRRKVGAVIFDPQTFHLLELGYNGRAAGLPGCLTENACPRGRLGYDQAPAMSPYLSGAAKCDAIHAEDNALRRAKERHLDVAGMHVAVTAEPCEGCRVLMRHYDIASVLWPEGQESP